MQNWTTIARVLSRRPARTQLRVQRSAIEHPVHAGLRRTVGVPRGQIADYRLPLGPETWLHVTEYAHEYLVHREVRARTTPVAAAPAKPGAGALLGFFVGLALGGTVSGALAGLALGAVVDAGTKKPPRPRLAGADRGSGIEDHGVRPARKVRR